jgi:predicted transcriptional regulator
MEFQLPPELHARLRDLATQQGRSADELVEEVLSKYLDEESRFLKTVEEGLAAAERGDFLEEDEIDARVEAMFRA